MDINVVETVEKAITTDPYQLILNRLRQSTNSSYDSMLGDGQLIIKELYNGNYDEAKKKRYSKNSSISKLMKHIRQDKSGSLPSRSIVYNFVNLAIDDHYLSNDDDEVVVQTYRHFSVSHKILLTQVSDLKTKKVLILETVENKYSVRELKKRIQDEKKANDSNPLKIHEKLDEKILRDCDYWRLRATEEMIRALKENMQEKLKLLESNLDAIAMMLKSRQTQQN